MSALILTYSYSGNTRQIGEAIQKLTGATIVEIEPVNAYPANYDACVKQAEKEVKQGFEPELQALSISLDEYDTIYLGTPVWWYTFAPPLRTLLNSTDWTGKTVYPFATHGGGLGSTFEDFKAFCKNADVKDGFDIYFSGKSHRKTEGEIKAWLER